jgi:hypothetical protein
MKCKICKGELIPNIVNEPMPPPGSNIRLTIVKFYVCQDCGLCYDGNIMDTLQEKPKQQPPSEIMLGADAQGPQGVDYYTNYCKIVEENKKLQEYLGWALSIIDSYFQETGKIGMAEAIIYKAAKSYIKKGDDPCPQKN